MADDLGWGQLSSAGHSEVKTPHLDAMAANGLNFRRFYSGGATCSPTRATFLTGRYNDRTGVQAHGFPRRLQEKTIAQALSDAGFHVAHFGKWHLNGLRGPGVPLLASDTHHPGAFGFDHWVTTSNYYDLDPIISQQGEVVQWQGDSSEATVDAALAHLKEQYQSGPTCTLIWFGTPHSPMIALEKDRAQFDHLPENEQHQYGEILAMARSIGTVRSTLREWGIAEETFLFFCSDNGGLKGYGKETNGGLRGYKGSLDEGGVRIPAVAEWPVQIAPGGVTERVSSTVDIGATLQEWYDLDESALLPQDGQSLLHCLGTPDSGRTVPLYFRQTGKGALVTQRWKLHFHLAAEKVTEIYDLERDPAESTNLLPSLESHLSPLISSYWTMNESVERSIAGLDYPEKAVLPQPPDRHWGEDETYRQLLPMLLEIPYYKEHYERSLRAGKRASEQAKKVRKTAEQR